MKITISNKKYDINNLNNDNEILIFSSLTDKLNNLPINTTEIWLKSNIENDLIKLPFGCVIKYF